MLVTTGEVEGDYTVIDVVFALGSHRAGFGQSSADARKAFFDVKEKLSDAGRQLGAEAIVHCSFDYRIAVSSGFLSRRQVIEFFAYGTAIRFDEASAAADIDVASSGRTE